MGVRQDGWRFRLAQGASFRAPAIDCKRPYGNSDVLLDIAELLGVPFDDEGGPGSATAERLMRLHRELQTVLQIVLKTGEFRAGLYEASKYGSDWVCVAD